MGILGQMDSSTESNLRVNSAFKHNFNQIITHFLEGKPIYTILKNSAPALCWRFTSLGAKVELTIGLHCTFPLAPDLSGTDDPNQC